MLAPRNHPESGSGCAQSLQLDETLAGPHRTLGQILMVHYWKWDEGEKELQRAAELAGGRTNPRKRPATLRERHRTDGGFADAVAAAELNRTRDPLSFAAQVTVGVVYRSAGQHDRAIMELRRALEMSRRIRARISSSVSPTSS